MIFKIREGDPKLIKKLKKLKQMEEDNKRLRELLKYSMIS